MPRISQTGQFSHHSSSFTYFPGYLPAKSTTQVRLGGRDSVGMGVERIPPWFLLDNGNNRSTSGVDVTQGKACTSKMSWRVPLGPNFTERSVSRIGPRSGSPLPTGHLIGPRRISPLQPTVLARRVLVASHHRPTPSIAAPDRLGHLIGRSRLSAIKYFRRSP